MIIECFFVIESLVALNLRALNDFVVDLIKKRITSKHLDVNGKPSKEAKPDGKFNASLWKKKN